MAYLPTFKHDIFISYAHIDNRPLTPGQRGWIDAFHETLEVRLAMVLGADADVWRDPRLSGSEHLDDSLPDRVRGTEIFVSIVSPRYVQSESCLKELQVFWESAGETGGLLIGNLSRIFKVVKLPVDSPEPPLPLRGAIGYDFYEVDRKGIPHELDPDLGEKERRGFRIKVDDIAYHIRELLKQWGDTTVVRPPPKPGRAVYLADTTWDLREERETVQRELRQRGLKVFPEGSLSYTPEFRELVREQLRQCDLSVHLVGSHYGVVPECETASVVPIQYKLAGERIGTGGFTRIVWIPEGASPGEDRQREFLQALRTDPVAHAGTEILEGAGIEDLKTTIHDVLERSTPQQAVPAPVPSRSERRVYIICDPVDEEPCYSIRDYLLAQGVEPILPLMEGTEAEVREDHQQNLVTCDAALLFWGRAGEAWLRAQLRELLKAPGYGRASPIPVQGLLLGTPASPAKERFATLQVMVMREEETFASSLRPFLVQLLPAT